MIERYLASGIEHQLFDKIQKFSKNWSDIKQWSDHVYLPFKVEPTQQIQKLNEYMGQINIGNFILSRFTYGMPIHISNFQKMQVMFYY